MFDKFDRAFQKAYEQVISESIRGKGIGQAGFEKASDEELAIKYGEKHMTDAAKRWLKADPADVYAATGSETDLDLDGIEWDDVKEYTLKDDEVSTVVKVAHRKKVPILSVEDSFGGDNVILITKAGLKTLGGKPYAGIETLAKMNKRVRDGE